MDRCLRSRTDDLEQYQRRNNLRVIGIPETESKNTDQPRIDMIKGKLDIRHAC